MSTISASTTTTTAYKVTADTTGTLVLQTGSTPTTAVTIDTSQNVGIGTSSPSNYGKFAVIGNVSYAGKNVAGFFQSNASGSSVLNIQDTTSGYGVGVGSVGNNLALYYSSGGNLIEGSRIDSSGNWMMNSGYGSVATAYGCRAWVNFNGTGTVAIRASGNVTSITDNGVGNYTVNFTTAMPDANYSAVVTNVGLQNGDTRRNSVIAGNETTGPQDMTTTAIRVNVGNPASLSLSDNSVMCVSIFR